MDKSFKKDTSKKTKYMAIIAIVLLVALIVVALVWFTYKPSESMIDNNAKSLTADQQKETTTDADNVAVKLDRIKNSKKVTVGTEMVFNSIKAVVSSAKASKTISSDDYGSSDSAGNGAMFLIIELTETNINSTPFEYRSFALIDEKGNNYSPYDAAGSIDNYMDGRELTPNIPETGKAVYRIPTDVKKFYLGGDVVGSDGGIFTVISLK